MRGTRNADARDDRQRRSVPRRVRHVVAFAAIAAAQFGVFEAGLRVWGSSEAAPAFQGLFEGDPVVGYRLKPHARVRFTTSEFDTELAINGAGLRDDEELGPKAPDERRIVLLGDSLVLSVQVGFSQTFGELLERRLNSRSGPYRYRVINAGVQGYGPVEEALFFREIAPTLQPDLVIETIFVGNDAEEAFRSAPRLSGNAATAVTTVRDSLATRLRRIVRRSMVLQVLRLRAVAATERFTGTLGTPEPPLQSYAANPAPRIAQGIGVTRECVEDIGRTAAASGARTIVALMPARFQLDDADYGRLKATVAQSGGELLRDGATVRFDAAFADLPLARIDLLPALRRALPGPDLFFQQTVHLTPRGHEVVADALDRFISEHVIRGEARTDAPRRDER
jgi:lysophospholipase L1-like esterase